MFETLEQIYDKFNYHKKDMDTYIKYEKEILDIFNNKNIDKYMNNNYKILYVWIGHYYLQIEKDYEQMKKYYLMAIKQGCLIAMNNLGLYYKKIEKDYDKMKYYYSKAIKQGHSDAMCNLGLYNENIKRYETMKYYYLMAIKQGNSKAMFGLGHYYHFINKNYDKMKHYYLMAIEQKYSDAMFNLGHYYHFIEKKYDKMKEYYLMAIKQGCSEAMNNLGNYYENIEKDYDKMKKYFLMAIKQNQNYLLAKTNLKLKTTPLERYVDYKQHGISFDEELTKDIHIYNNKLKNAKTDDCQICLGENKKNILLNCFFHCICTDCYIKLYDKPCPFCKL